MLIVESRAEIVHGKSRLVKNQIIQCCQINEEENFSGWKVYKKCLKIWDYLESVSTFPRIRTQLVSTHSRKNAQGFVCFRFRSCPAQQALKVFVYVLDDEYNKRRHDDDDGCVSVEGFYTAAFFVHFVVVRFCLFIDSGLERGLFGTLGNVNTSADN